MKFQEWLGKVRFSADEAETALKNGLPPVYVDYFADAVIEDNPNISLEEFLRFPDAIVSEKFSRFALSRILEQDGRLPGNRTFTYYIDNGGNVPKFGINAKSSEPSLFESLVGQDYQSSFIDSNAGTTINQDHYADYIRGVFDEFNVLSDGAINFVEVSNDDHSMLSVYRVPPGIKNPRGSDLLGVALPASNGQSYWRNIFYSDTVNLGSPERNSGDTLATIRHEIGHALGLSHPTELSTYLFLGNWQDGFNSAYQIGPNVEGSSAYEPGITVMSYNQPEFGKTYFEFSDADKLAIRKIWAGLGTSSSSAFSPFNLNKDDLQIDIITSTSAVTNDSKSNGFYRLGAGDDIFEHRDGFDAVIGEAGSDIYVFRSGATEGHLTIKDFDIGEDLLYIDPQDFSSVSMGGQTVILSSDTDIVAVLNGEYTTNQLNQRNLHPDATKSMAFIG